MPLPLAMRTRRAPSMIDGSVRSWRGHRLDDGLDLADLAVVDLRRGLLQVLRHARDQGHHARHRSHLLDLLELLEEVLEGEAALHHGGGALGGDLLVHGALGLLDEAEHVAHPEDAVGHPVGVELVEVVELLAGGGEGDGPAHHLLDREGRPPRASPSSLVRITPSRVRASWKAEAVDTASWPVMASMTRKV